MKKIKHPYFNKRVWVSKRGNRYILSTDLIKALLGIGSPSYMYGLSQSVLMALFDGTYNYEN